MNGTSVQPEQGYGMTEIGIVPEEWEITTLGELFHIQQGKALSPKSRAGKSPRPFLRTANVLWGHIDLMTVDKMDFSEQEFERLLLRPGDLLVCEGGEVGRTAMWRGEIEHCSYQNHIHRLHPRNSNVVPEFYMYWMQAAIVLLGLYVGSANRTTIPNLSKSRLGQFTVPLPPPSEQKRIAAVLSAVQRAKEKIEAVIAATKELKKSLIKHLFTYGPVPVSEAENRRLKETEIGVLPEGWEVSTLGAEGLFQYGFTASATDVDTGTRFLRITDISDNGWIDWRTVPCAEVPADLSACYKLSKGDILFARIGGSTGKTSIIRERPNDTVFASYLIRLRVRDRLDPLYVFYYTQTEMYRTLVSAGKEGKLKKGLNAAQLKDFAIPLPALAEQRRIAAVISQVEHKLAMEESKRTALDRLFRTLLRDLMTAKIRVNNSGVLADVVGVGKKGEAL